MANIDLEKFLLDLIDTVERYGDENKTIDVYAIRGVLKMQGYKISREGKLIGVDEVEPEPPKIYLVYDRNKDRFKESDSKPPLTDDFDCYVNVGGTDFYVRLSDYHAHLAKEISSEISKNMVYD